ncbi:hypothetical protein T06_15083 [Trichinella sp. T6]|nr:hypothetical protein T06_15083 [Trichinella sp. T6]
MKSITVQMLFESYTFLEGIGCSFISLPIAQIKIAKYVTFLSISHEIRFCTTSDQGSSTSETPLKRSQDD